jgi:O-methyltransferase involved in polyketide biosynthesis
MNADPKQKRTSNMQILSLGAGFDTTFFNLSAKYGEAPTTLPMMMTYYEVDLDSNVERKAALIRRSVKCRRFLGISTYR